MECRGILNVWRSYTSIRFSLFSSFFLFLIPLILGSDGPGYNDTGRNMRALVRYRRVRNMNQFTTRRYHHPNPEKSKGWRVYFRELESFECFTNSRGGRKKNFYPFFLFSSLYYFPLLRIFFINMRYFLWNCGGQAF